MKRVAWLLVAVLPLALCACRSGSSPEAPPGGSPVSDGEAGRSTSSVGIAVRVALPGVLHATVLGADGQPLPGAVVWVPGGGVSNSPATPSLRIQGEAVGPTTGPAPLLIAPPSSAMSVMLQAATEREVTLLRGEEVALSRTLPPGGLAGFPLKQEGLYTFRCAPQPCSGTAVLVAGAAGQTDASGKVSLIEVPPGQVIAHVWAPGLGEKTAPVTVAPGPPAELNISYQAAPSP